MNSIILSACADELLKIAEERPPPLKNPGMHMLKTVAQSTGGFAAGTLIGYGLAELADRAARTQGTSIKPVLVKAAPYMGAAMSVLYGAAKAREAEELRRAWEDLKDKRLARVSGK